MGFYYGDAWDGISEWVDGIGWVDPNEGREEEPEQVYQVYAIIHEWHDSRLIPHGDVDYLMGESEQDVIDRWLEIHGNDWDFVWARLATEVEIEKWEKEIDEWVDNLPFD